MYNLEAIKFGYVILHYMNYDSSYSTLTNITKNVNLHESVIVVVDNNSTNDSYVNLQKDSKFRNFIFISNTENYGFSRGNNIGVDYIKNNFNTEFIVVLNNDINIISTDINNEIIKSYNSKKFDVLGPSIINIHNNREENPVCVSYDLESSKRRLKYFKKSYKYLNSLVPYLYWIYRKIFKGIKGCKRVGLHGSFLVFHKSYFDRYNETFKELTFLYGEENFLYYRKVRDDLIFKFDKNIKVVHAHSLTTSSIYTKKIEKWRMQHKHQMYSLEKLVELYDELDKNENRRD